MVYVTRRAQFSAAHRLFNPSFTDAENERIFDKCNNINGHGHNYTVDVTVAGEPDQKTGYVIDLKKLSHIMEAEVISKVDHKHLNYDVDFLRGTIPTAENIAMAFWNILEPKIKDGKLYCVKVYESEHNFVEYFGVASPLDRAHAMNGNTAIKATN
ncbi:MAG TPA: 6-carboxytetrahydropterin synthase [Candidatus Kapabacteria bacterium]|nr:6-carboxytetrahydropterin synthase [Candidatus Kapabacteria bacterium]